MLKDPDDSQRIFSDASLESLKGKPVTNGIGGPVIGRLGQRVPLQFNLPQTKGVVASDRIQGLEPQGSRPEGDLMTDAEAHELAEFVIRFGPAVEDGLVAE